MPRRIIKFKTTRITSSRGCPGRPSPAHVLFMRISLLFDTALHIRLALLARCCSNVFLVLASPVCFLIVSCISLLLALAVIWLSMLLCRLPTMFLAFLLISSWLFVFVLRFFHTRVHVALACHTPCFTPWVHTRNSHHDTTSVA